MLKIMALAHRRVGMTLDAFSDYWRTTHRQHALRLAGAGFTRGYVQNHRLSIHLDGLSVAADGVAEVWVEDIATLENMGRSTEYREGAMLDETNFLDVENTTTLILTPENVIREGARRMAALVLTKAMFFIPLPSKMSKPMRDKMINHPHPLLMQGSEPVRLSRHFSLEDSKPSDGSNVLVETSWWADRDCFEAAWGARQLTVEGSQIFNVHPRLQACSCVKSLLP